MLLDWVLVVLTLLVALLIFAIVIFVHELGHYLVGRRFGMLAHEFAVGFGPRLWAVRRGDTIYSVRAIPMGGFVRFLGASQSEDTQPAIPVGQKVYASLGADGRMDAIYFYEPGKAMHRASGGRRMRTWVEGIIQDVDIKDRLQLTLSMRKEDSEAVQTYSLIPGTEVHLKSGEPTLYIVPPPQRFDSKGIVPRFLTFLAGPVFNLLLVVPLCLLLIGVGGTDRPVIDRVVSDSPAAASGIEKGSIVGVDGYELLGRLFMSSAIASSLRKGQEEQPIKLTIQQEDGSQQTHTLPQTEGVRVQDRMSKAAAQIAEQWGGKAAEEFMRDGTKWLYYGLGIESRYVSQKIGVLEGITSTFSHTTWLIKNTVVALAGLFTKGVPLYGPNRSISGPVKIFRSLSESVRESLSSLIFKVASFNVGLALFNLVPFIPSFDGGRISLLVVEAVRRRPLSARGEQILFGTSMVFLVLFFIYIFIGDILQQFFPQLGK